MWPYHCCAISSAIVVYTRTCIVCVYMYVSVYENWFLLLLKLGFLIFFSSHFFSLFFCYQSKANTKGRIKWNNSRRRIGRRKKTHTEQTHTSTRILHVLSMWYHNRFDGHMAKSIRYSRQTQQKMITIPLNKYVSPSNPLLIMYTVWVFLRYVYTYVADYN